MPIEEAVLSPCSGNKEKKSATSKNAQSRKRARSVEENRRNAAHELAIEEEKENVEQPQNSEKEDDEFIDQAKEEHQLKAI